MAPLANRAHNHTHHCAHWLCNVRPQVKAKSMNEISRKMPPTINCSSLSLLSSEVLTPYITSPLCVKGGLSLGAPIIKNEHSHSCPPSPLCCQLLASNFPRLPRISISSHSPSFRVIVKVKSKVNGSRTALKLSYKQDLLSQITPKKRGF